MTLKQLNQNPCKTLKKINDKILKPYNKGPQKNYFYFCEENYLEAKYTQQEFSSLFLYNKDSLFYFHNVICFLTTQYYFEFTKNLFLSNKDNSQHHSMIVKEA